MKKLNIPVGVSNFEEIRKTGSYYVDKTGLIEELLKTFSTQVTLVTRPRRFGKTLGMSMLASFFDVRKDSGELFKGLKIAENIKISREWMNRYPVIFLSLKDVDGLSFESAKDMLRMQIASLYNEHFYLKQSEQVNENDREIFGQLANVVQGRPTDAMLKVSLAVLMRMMEMHYGKKVILLLDEYDVPLAKASSHKYYNEMLEIIRAMMSTALKDNTSLQFAVITGCLRVSKESIFTGTNNFVSDTISDTRLNEYFGFTQKEVDRIMAEAKREDQLATVKSWYDGYHFGEFDIYCPWDVMNYVSRLQTDPNVRPASYWKNTSDNAIIRSFIDMKSDTITGKLEILMSGGYINQKIEENLTYDYLNSSEDNLWSVLYLTGYLTRMRKSDLTETEWIGLENSGKTALTIPNAEIREIFETTIQKWFDDSARTWNRTGLFDAVWNGNSEKATQEMNRLLRLTISYHDYREDFYHAFLAGIFTGAGYMVESNKEHGEGRSDVVVKDLRHGRVAVFELKYTKIFDKLSEECDTALHQIDDRMYAKEFEDSFDEILCYGIAFYKKRCMVKKK